MVVTVFTCVGPIGPGLQIVTKGEVGFNSPYIEDIYEKIERYYGIPYKELVFRNVVHSIARQVCEVCEP